MPKVRHGHTTARRAVTGARRATTATRGFRGSVPERNTGTAPGSRFREQGAAMPWRCSPLT
jgi:hypothetical protein